jgi:predicted RNA-binding Zn-ribbon protein involved in translation (DUF1610 family)
MASIKSRIEYLDKGRKQCPVCLQPGPYPTDMQVEIKVKQIVLDDNGRAVIPQPAPPKKTCPECGRSVIHRSHMGAWDSGYWDFLPDYPPDEE